LSPDPGGDKGREEGVGENAEMKKRK